MLNLFTEVKKVWAIVKFSYDTNDPEELPLQPDEVIEIVQQSDDGWWKGTTRAPFSLFPLLPLTNNRPEYIRKRGNLSPQFCRHHR